MTDQMPEAKQPFQSFSFMLVEGRRPRAALRLKAEATGMFELHVEKGSAANPISQFTRTVPADVAQKLRDAMQAAGVFGWEESYDDDPSQPARRWTLNLVFQEGVFSVTSKGGSGVPSGFDQLLEELYRLDFPRPDDVAKSSGGSGAFEPGRSPSHFGQGASGYGRLGDANPHGGMGPSGDIAGFQAAFSSGSQPTGFGGSPSTPGIRGFGSMIGASGFTGMGGLSAGDLGAYSVSGSDGGMDFSRLADMMKGSGFEGFEGLKDLEGVDASEMSAMLSDMARNPQAMQQRMRDEFRHMSPDEQQRLLDQLASTGMASRAWWERFLRGM